MRGQHASWRRGLPRTASRASHLRSQVDRVLFSEKEHQKGSRASGRAQEGAVHESTFGRVAFECF